MFILQGPYIMSSSLDGSIRVWSMESCDEVDLYVCLFSAFVVKTRIFTFMVKAFKQFKPQPSCKASSSEFI